LIVWFAYAQGADAETLHRVVLTVCSELGPWGSLDREQQAWCTRMVWSALGYQGVGILGADYSIVDGYDRDAFSKTLNALQGCQYERDDVTPEELNELAHERREMGPTVESFGDCLRMMRRLPGWDDAMRDEPASEAVHAEVMQ